MHLSTVAGKEVVEQYYGKPHHKAYYLGCSTGEIQSYYHHLFKPHHNSNN